MSDAALLARINQNKEKRRKYKAVMNAIDSRNLNLSRSGDMSAMEEFLETYKKKVQTLESENGYEYLSTLAGKLKSDLTDIEEYLDYAKDSIYSLTDMYETLRRKKELLDSQISDDVDQYNKDKPFWEHERKGDGLFW